MTAPVAPLAVLWIKAVVITFYGFVIIGALNLYGFVSEKLEKYKRKEEKNNG